MPGCAQRPSGRPICSAMKKIPVRRSAPRGDVAVSGLRVDESDGFYDRLRTLEIELDHDRPFAECGNGPYNDVFTLASGGPRLMLLPVGVAAPAVLNAGNDPLGPLPANLGLTDFVSDTGPLAPAATGVVFCASGGPPTAVSIAGPGNPPHGAPPFGSFAMVRRSGIEASMASQSASVRSIGRCMNRLLPIG